MMKICTFQVKVVDDVNRNIKSVAAQQGISKHEWIVRAIDEKMKRELSGRAV